MRNFKQNNRGGGGGGGGRPEMHQVVCSECGKDCEVPFKPTGDKPVYCNDCFRNKGNSGQRKFSGGSGGNSGRFNSDKRMHQAVCNNCGKDCEVPFRPTGDKPVYCSECFNKGEKGKSPSQSGGGQLGVINAKLDQILKALKIDDSDQTDEKKEVVKKTNVKPKVSKPKKVIKSKVKKTVAPKKAKPKVKAKAKKKK